MRRNKISNLKQNKVDQIRKLSKELKGIVSTYFGKLMYRVADTFAFMEEEASKSLDEEKSIEELIKKIKDKKNSDGSYETLNQFNSLIIRDVKEILSQKQDEKLKELYDEYKDSTIKFDGIDGSNHHIFEFVFNELKSAVDDKLVVRSNHGNISLEICKDKMGRPTSVDEMPSCTVNLICNGRSNENKMSLTFVDNKIEHSSFMTVCLKPLIEADTNYIKIGKLLPSDPKGAEDNQILKIHLRIEEITEDIKSSKVNMLMGLQDYLSQKIIELMTKE